MTRASTKSLFYNLILAALLVVTLVLSMLGQQRLTVLALEQDVRCGFAEHIHSEECYLDEFLICGQKAHTHSPNCYLVLLKDNDVNRLLQTMSHTESKSLENLIGFVLEQALALNGNYSQSTPVVQLTGQDITALNDTLASNNIMPGMVLNANLSNGTIVTYAPGSGNTSTLDVGGNASTGTNAINFYIILDGKVTFVSSGTLTNNNPRRYTYANVAAAYTPYVLTGLTSSNIGSYRTYGIRYNTTGSTSSVSDFTSNANYTNNSSRMTFGYGNSVRYALLTNSSNQAINFYTVTLDYSGVGGTNQVQYVESGLDSTLELSDEYFWVDANGNTVDASDLENITATTHLYAKSKSFTVTYINGSQTNQVTVTGGSHTVQTPPEGYCWRDGNGKYYSGGETITAAKTLTAVKGHTITYIAADGTESTVFVEDGTTVTLPALSGSYKWYDDAGNAYAGGSSYGPVSGSVTFKAKQPLTLNYDVNFSGTLNNQLSNSSLNENTPTISNTTGTTATETLGIDDTTVLLNVTPRLLTAPTTDQTYLFDTAGYMVGWKVEETGDILSPADIYSHDELAAYDTNGDGTLSLVGVWETGWSHAANFVISYTSITTGAASRNNYTDSLYTTYVDVPDSMSLTDKTYYGDEVEANTAANDAVIRALQGSCTDTAIGIHNIPPDDYFFGLLKDLKNEGDNSLSMLSIDGVTIPIEDLNSDVFTIRWYVVKYYAGDGWHVDGKLVRKTGNIIVTKTFDGRSSYVEAAQNGFTITAQAGTLDDSGTFTDNAQLSDYTLLVSREAADSDTYTLGYDTRVETVDTATGSTKVEYSWVIPKIGAGEIWQLKENIVEVENSTDYGEWVIVDSSNAQSKDGIGTKTTVVGVTFPEDVSSTEWLQANFTNVYYTKNALLIRKVDSLTGEKVDGAIFNLYQDGKLMAFRYEDGRYVYDPTGTITQVSSDGTEILVEDFAYGAAPITVTEVKAPAGYLPLEHSVTIGYTGEQDTDGHYIIDILNSDEAGDSAAYSNGLLIVKNKADTVNVTVEKVWLNCTADDWTDSVRVQLLANGSASLAADLQPDSTSTIQNLTKQQSDGNYYYTTYTWYDLPRYAGGEAITWSAKEIAIGAEEIKADGTFPNWNSYVDPTVTSADGSTQHITVSNMPKASTALRVQKTDKLSGVAIPGVTFTIEDTAGNLLGTATTDSSGSLFFYRLKYETTYILRETTTPFGYQEMSEPISVKIYGNGTVEVLSHPYAQPGASNYTLLVTNQPYDPLPDSGGMGTTIYTQTGLLLMLAALALLVYKRMHRREDDPSYV